MKSVVIVKVGDTFSSIAAQLGDFEHWVQRGIASSGISISVIDPRSGGALPDHADVAAAIITGSHSMVTDRAPWSEQLAQWMRGAVECRLPLLGICYGHQLLAHALGGEVGYHPDGIEIGTVKVRLRSHARDDALFGCMPDEFAAHAVHRQTVRRLPAGAIPLAGNAFEPHHAFRLGDFAWGVQFHPEFCTAAMSGYIKEVMRETQADAATLEPMLSGVRTTDHAASVIQSFVDLAVRK